MLAGKIKIKSGMDINSACETINRMGKSLQETVPNLKWSFIEPDITP